MLLLDTAGPRHVSFLLAAVIPSACHQLASSLYDFPCARAVQKQTVALNREFPIILPASSQITNSALKMSGCNTAAAYTGVFRGSVSPDTNFNALIKKLYALEAFVPAV